MSSSQQKLAYQEEKLGVNKSMLHFEVTRSFNHNPEKKNNKKIKMNDLGKFLGYKHVTFQQYS